MKLKKIVKAVEDVVLAIMLILVYILFAGGFVFGLIGLFTIDVPILPNKVLIAGGVTALGLFLYAKISSLME